MTNVTTLKDPATVKDIFLRESLAILVRNHGPDDIVQTLATVMDEYAMKYARRTGDYDGASAMKLISDYLDGLDDYIENYDGAPHDNRMDNLQIVFDRTDWVELAAQQKALLGVLATRQANARLHSLLNWLDAVQDAAKMDGFQVKAKETTP